MSCELATKRRNAMKRAEANAKWGASNVYHRTALLGCLAVTPLLFNGNQALLLSIPRRHYLAKRTAAQYGFLSIPQKQVPLAFGGAFQLHGTAKTACRDALQCKGGPQQNLFFEPKECV